MPSLQPAFPSVEMHFVSLTPWLLEAKVIARISQTNPIRQNAPYTPFHSKSQRNLWCWRASYFFWLALLQKSHALFSSLQNSYCVNKVLLIPSGWLCRKAILAKLLYWVKVILLKTSHNCFSLLSLILSTGNLASLSQDSAFCEGRISWPKVRNSVNARGIWPGISLSQLLYFWPRSKENGKIEENQNRWEFIVRVACPRVLITLSAKSPRHGAGPWGGGRESSSAGRVARPTLLTGGWTGSHSSKGCRESTGSWHWK